MKRIAIILFTLSLCMVPTFAVTNTTEYMNMAFWQKFNDDILVDNLIRVYKNNNDLKAAVLKVNEGNRIVKMSFANELPHVGFQGYVGRIFSSSDELFGEVKIPNYAETHYLLPLTMNYEIDIWGKNHLITKSKKKQLEMIKQDERASYIYISSAFAVDYYNLIRTDKLISYQKELIELQNKIIDSYKTKYELGTATLSDIEQAQKNLTYMKEELQKLSEKQDLLKNQLSVLLSDRAFESIERAEFDSLNIAFIPPKEIKFDVIRGNISEIKTLALGSGTTKGVDADIADVITEDNLDEAISFVKSFAKKTGAIIAITGAIDLVSDEERCFVIRNGRKEMSRITGTGCQLSGMMTAFLIANKNPLEAAVASVCMMGLAGEIAWNHMQEGDGNASYRNRIIDAIFNMDEETLNKGAKYDVR
jgi:hypothetical protein